MLELDLIFFKFSERELQAPFLSVWNVYVSLSVYQKQCTVEKNYTFFLSLNKVHFNWKFLKYFNNYFLPIILELFFLMERRRILNFFNLKQISLKTHTRWILSPFPSQSWLRSFSVQIQKSFSWKNFTLLDSSLLFINSQRRWSQLFSVKRNITAELFNLVYEETYYLHALSCKL